MADSFQHVPALLVKCSDMEQTRADDRAADWTASTVQTVFTNITNERRRQGLSAQDVANRCAEIGTPIDRRVISKMDNHSRSTISVPELLVIAEALGAAPLDLIYSPYDAGDSTARLPRVDVDGVTARDLFVRFDAQQSSYPASKATQVRAILDMRAERITEGSAALRRATQPADAAAPLPPGYVDLLLGQVRFAARSVADADDGLRGMGVSVPPAPAWVAQFAEPADDSTLAPELDQRIREKVEELIDEYQSKEGDDDGAPTA